MIIIFSLFSSIDKALANSYNNTANNEIYLADVAPDPGGENPGEAPDPGGENPGEAPDPGGENPGNEQPELNGIELPTGTGLTDRPILDIIVTVLTWLIRVFLLLAFIAFVITGLQFLLATGNAYSGAAQNAKQNFGYAIMALVVVGSSYIIMLTIDKLLQGY